MLLLIAAYVTKSLHSHTRCANILAKLGKLGAMHSGYGADVLCCCFDEKEKNLSKQTSSVILGVAAGETAKLTARSRRNLCTEVCVSVIDIMKLGQDINFCL